MLRNQPFDTMGTVLGIARLFGGKDRYRAALKELETALYRDVVYHGAPIARGTDL